MRMFFLLCEAWQMPGSGLPFQEEAKPIIVIMINNEEKDNEWQAKVPLTH